MPILKDDYKKEEKINGIIYNMSPSPHFNHGIVNGNIYGKLKEGLKGSLCLPFIENLDYKYQPDINDDYVIPDVMIICDRKKLKGGSYSGVPVFIAETLSPSTAMRDKTIKKDMYEKCGVEEYWILSAKEKAVDIYYLKNNRYQLVNSYILEDDNKSEHYNADQIISLRGFPDIKMQLEDLFEGLD